MPSSSRNTWLFVPTLYFFEGLPYVLINTVSVIMYKRMGVDNASIAFWTSWLYLPWVIKMFWAPTVEMSATRRSWILWMQLAMGLSLFVAACSLNTPHFFILSLFAFVACAFISATNDIATDGFYMFALTEKEQALFAGLRTTFYRLAMIFGSGLLVYLAGRIEVATGNIPISWMLVLAAAAALFLLASLYHRFMLPYPTTDKRSGAVGAAETASFVEIVGAYFRQEGIAATVAFILFYRLGEAMLLKMVSPFLLDSIDAGGLGLNTSQVGLVYGTIGLLSLVSGGVLGGWLISKLGLRRCIWPMVLIMHLPDLFFVYMAYAQPSVGLVYPLVAIEQFGYGLGFIVFTVYLMYTTDSRHKTSHYAISTGIMALGMMFPGMISGAIQKAVGYQIFFIIVCIMTIPGMLTIPFILKYAENKAA
ncbi:MAG: MFS transporter [Deltaproteobacteria bacterium]|nr:MFS transporter [Deltaproteobacteria bacterium]